MEFSILELPTINPQPLGQPWLKTPFPILFAVDAKGEGHLVQAPDIVVDEMIYEFTGSMNMDEAGFVDVPEVPGFYKATAQFHYYPGYYEGYYEPGESSWEFDLTDITMVLA